MQGSLRLLTAVALSASLLTACGRKKQEQAESVLPVEESAQIAQEISESLPTAPDNGAPSIKPALLAVEEASPMPAVASAEELVPQPEIPVPADAPVAGIPEMAPAVAETDAAAPATEGVPAEVAQADAVYEAWFRKYNLDLNDPQMLDADADGDGVSNGDEFMADTNPRDPKSFPAQAAATTAESHGGLKLKQYNEALLPVVLESVKGNTAQIRRLDQEKIETVRVGDVIEGLGLRVGKVQSRRMTDKHGSGVDASRVTLEDPVTGDTTLLVKDMPVRAASSHAVLASEDGKTSFKVRMGETFEWPKNGGSTFKVLDLRADQAVLQEESSGRMWTVVK